MSRRRPDLGGAAARAPLGRFEREDAEKRLQRVRGHVADEGQVQQIAIVQHRRRFGDAALARVGRGAFDHQRLGRDADREDRAERRLVNRFREPLDGGGDRGMFRRIQRPVARGDEQRARHLQQASPEFRRQLGSLGHEEIMP